jgi:NSS family neurotransmitter:Na+ symporter
MSSKHTTWQSNVGYIMAMVGSAVGFANILSFSARCYYNGGGAFLIPLAVAIVVLGLPMLILEGVIGQQLQLPLVSACGKVAGTVGKFLGWMTVLGVMAIGSYYCVINAWTIAYIFYACADKIPTDTATFFHQTFLHDSGSLTSPGTISIPILFFIILVSLFTWVVTVRSIKSGIEKFCSFFLPLLFILLIFFAIFVSFLPGAFDGFKYYLIPNFSQLLNPKIWLTAFGHVFFSFSVGLAIIVGYSRYTDKQVNIAHSMFWVAFADIMTSLIAGLVIFGGIGYMAHVKQIPFESVVTSSLFGLGFVVFPQVFLLFPHVLKIIFGTLFFFSLFIAGITGMFSIVEAIAGNFEVEFSWSRQRAITTTSIILVCMALIYCAGNGAYIIDALDGMVSGFNVLFSGLAQIMVFMYYAPRVMEHSAWYQANGTRAFRYYMLRYIAPLLLCAVFVSSLQVEFASGLDAAKIIRWSWVLVASSIALILACIQKKK